MQGLTVVTLPVQTIYLRGSAFGGSILLAALRFSPDAPILANQLGMAHKKDFSPRQRNFRPCQAQIRSGNYSWLTKTIMIAYNKFNLLTSYFYLQYVQFLFVYVPMQI